MKQSFLSLFAPDVMYKNETCFIYFCQPGNTEGVATSKSPDGPFVNGERIYLKNLDQIGPAVFVDDDGQACYTCGLF